MFPLSTMYAELAADPESKTDGPQILAMVVPLTSEEAVARAALFGADLPAHWAADAELFTCKHWDEETRLCGIYAERPDMCRRYPYGRPCDQGCACEGTP